MSSSALSKGSLENMKTTAVDQPFTCTMAQIAKTQSTAQNNLNDNIKIVSQSLILLVCSKKSFKCIQKIFEKQYKPNDELLLNKSL